MMGMVLLENIDLKVNEWISPVHEVTRGKMLGLCLSKWIKHDKIQHRKIRKCRTLWIRLESIIQQTMEI